ncbi:hypothetical protein OIDMADRAFT_61625 [Oidiodendron maius Zn]|uniref:Uncharacterized protein n=1 Tax=Oidiodendron maius (strain Zn) TaxID=913774 RepID=A0A0C3GQ05_OIDMZ|nr:hypothetical protein OIDMADRAFT_61625 [Oidiodendron maius Zn]
MSSPRSSSRLFIVSNRLPITVRRASGGPYDISASTGGLVGAFSGLTGFTGFNWYGWPGVEVPDGAKEELTQVQRKNKPIPVFLEEGLADKILWPLLYYQTHEIKISSPD